MRGSERKVCLLTVEILSEEFGREVLREHEGEVLLGLLDEESTGSSAGLVLLLRAGNLLDVLHVADLEEITNTTEDGLHTLFHELDEMRVREHVSDESLARS